MAKQRLSGAPPQTGKESLSSQVFALTTMRAQLAIGPIAVTLMSVSIATKDLTALHTALCH